MRSLDQMSPQSSLRSARLGQSIAWTQQGRLCGPSSLPASPHRIHSSLRLCICASVACHQIFLTTCRTIKVISCLIAFPSKSPIRCLSRFHCCYRSLHSAFPFFFLSEHSFNFRWNSIYTCCQTEHPKDRLFGRLTVSHMANFQVSCKRLPPPPPLPPLNGVFAVPSVP